MTQKARNQILTRISILKLELADLHDEHMRLWHRRASYEAELSTLQEQVRSIVTKPQPKGDADDRIGGVTQK